MDEVHRLWGLLRDQQPEGVADAVAGARSVLVSLSEGADPTGLAELISGLSAERTSAASRRSVEIPVVYDGPDLACVGEAAGVAGREVAALHSAPTYVVGFLGFSPGFAYLFGGDPRLTVPRMSSPRTSVPAGSVAVADDMTAVYPQSTPGGWRLIGRTDRVLFDHRLAEPALLAPGDHVRFRPVARLDDPAVRSPHSSLRRPDPSGDAVEVMEPGPLLTVQDRGRRGWGHAGVPVAGAADMGSAQLATRLVGNQPAAAVLESTMGGCRLRMRCARTVAVTGAIADITVDGLPARLGVGLRLPAGAELAVGPCRQGLRVYVAVGGGFEVAEVLGSRSADTLSGLGPAPLRTGDLLPVGAPPGGVLAPGELPPPTPIPDRHGVLTVTARWGPRQDWLSNEGWATLRSADFTVGSASDRTGVRLEGPRVRACRSAAIPSEGMVPGAVQLPPSGHPIILMRNHPPTGGYPVVAVVDSAGVDSLAQAAPGQRVRFALMP